MGMEIINFNSNLLIFNKLKSNSEGDTIYCDASLNTKQANYQYRYLNAGTIIYSSWTQKMQENTQIASVKVLYIHPVGKISQLIWQVSIK